MQLLNEPPTQSMLQKLKVTHHVRPSSRHTPAQAEEEDTFEETVLLWVRHSWLRRLVVDERQRTPSHPPSLMIHVSEHNEAGHNLDLHDVLGNLSFPALTQIGGGFLISPITTLSRQVITGFPRAPRPSVGALELCRCLSAGESLSVPITTSQSSNHFHSVNMPSLN